MGMPPLKSIDSTGTTIDAATLKLKLPFNTAIKNGIQVEMLQPMNKNRLTVPFSGAFGSVTGINVGTYSVTVLADATNNWLTPQSPGIEPDIGQRVWVSSSTTVPGGLAVSTDYYVVGNIKQTTSGGIQLATTPGGSVIDITSAGSGTVRVIPMDRPFPYSSGTRPASGPVGAATIATNSTAPSSQVTDFLFTAGGGVGDFISFPFTIDASEKGQMLAVDFKYLLSSTGTLNAQVWVHDITNGVLVPVTPYLLQYSTALTQEFSGVFQASSNSTSYELIIFRGADSAAVSVVGTIKLNEITVARKVPARGPLITDWTAYTPTVVGLVLSNPEFRWRRVGDTIELSGRAGITSANGSVVSFSLPNGYVVYAADPTNWTHTMGVMYRFNTGTPYSIFATNTQTTFNVGLTAAFGTAQTGTALFNAGETFSFFAHFPIKGWSSNSAVSSAEDGRVCAAAYRLSANFTASTTTPINFDTIEYDTHGAVTVSATAWKFTAPLPGVYSVGGLLACGTSLFVYKNGVLLKQVSHNNGSWNYPIACDVSLLAGDYIDVRPTGSTTVTGGAAATAGTNYVSIRRTSGPSQIAASESIGASYWVTASFAASTTTPVNFDAKEWDSHNAVTTSATAWKFTAPISGVYSISGFLNISAGAYILVYKNGVALKTIGYENGGDANSWGGTVRLLAGEYIDIRPSGAVTFTGNAALATVGGTNIVISRIGNY